MTMLERIAQAMTTYSVARADEMVADTTDWIRYGVWHGMDCVSRYNTQPEAWDACRMMNARAVALAMAADPGDAVLGCLEVSGEPPHRVRAIRVKRWRAMIAAILEDQP